MKDKDKTLSSEEIKEYSNIKLEKCYEVNCNPETAPFLYRIDGPIAFHNYLCAVCRDEKAVIDLSEGVLQPCWVCQKSGYRVVRLNWFTKFFWSKK